MTPVVLFDSHCILCSASARFVLAHERAPWLRFVALRSAEGRCLALRHNVDPDDPISFLLIADGRVHRESDAALRLARYLSAPWSLLAGFRIVPRILRDGAYRFIARHRYGLFGRSEACIPPDPSTRARFALEENT